MKRHDYFEDVPTGFQFYCLGEKPDYKGVWLPTPLYWIASQWRDLKLIYWAFQLRRRRDEN